MPMRAAAVPMETQDNIEGQPSAGARLQLARNIARALNSANNAIALYPSDSPMPREAAAGFIAALDRLLAFEPYLQLSVSGNGLFLDGEDVCGTSSSLSRFAFILHSRQVGQIRFLPGMDEDECVSFLRTLAEDPNVLRNKGGLTKALGAAGVVKVKVVDLAQEAAADSARSEAPDSGATRVEGVVGLSDSALVADDSAQVRTWLHEAAGDIASRGLSHEASAVELARVLAVEAGQAITLGGAETELGLENLAEAVGSLDDETRRGLLSMLLASADSAGEALAALLSRIGDDELAAALAAEATRSGADPSELLRSPALGAARRDAIVGKAKAAVDSAAPPTPAAPPPPPVPRVKVDPSLPRFSRKGDNIAVPVAQLVADARQFTQEERNGLLQVPNEAQRNQPGKSIDTLLYLLNRTSAPDRTAETVGAVVEMASYSLDMGRVDLLAKAVGGIRERRERAYSESAETHPFDEAIASLSSEQIGGKAVALLEDEGGDARVRDVASYLAAADPSVQDIAIETVGNQISGELKDRIHAVFQALGPRAIGAMERHVADGNWVIARSAVLILAATGEPRVVPALRRALGHAEDRVAEQAVKGLANIGSPEAVDAVVSAIDHGSGQTRLLAIQAAGKLGSDRAVSALARIFAGSDLFGRGLEEKTAAVQALVGIGGTAAVSALEHAARRRFLLSPGKTKRFRRAVADGLRQLAAASEPGGNGTQQGIGPGETADAARAGTEVSAAGAGSEADASRAGSEGRVGG